MAPDNTPNETQISSLLSDSVNRINPGSVEIRKVCAVHFRVMRSKTRIAAALMPVSKIRLFFIIKDGGSVKKEGLNSNCFYWGKFDPPLRVGHH
jgi:hypothetical protein